MCVCVCLFVGMFLVVVICLFVVVVVVVLFFLGGGVLQVITESPVGITAPYRPACASLYDQFTSQSSTALSHSSFPLLT